MSEGQDAIAKLRAGGFTNDEVIQYQTDQTRKLTDGGFSKDEINSYWGIVTPPDTLHNAINDELTHQKWDHTKLNMADPESWWTNFWAGNGWGATAMAEGYKPTLNMSPDATMGSKIAFGAGQMIGDAPEFAAGFMGAGVATANPLVGFAAGGATPELIRQVRLDEWEHGTTDNNVSFGQRAMHVVGEVAKAGAAAAVGGAVAGPLGSIVARSGGGMLARTLSEGAAFGVASTSAGAAMEARLPTTEELAYSVALGLAVPGAAHYGPKVAALVKSNVMNIWAKTGANPVNIARNASVDPYLKQSMVSTTPDGDPITNPWSTIGTREPSIQKPEEIDAKTGEPVKPPETIKADEEPVPEPLKAEETSPANPENGLREGYKGAGAEQLLPLVRGLERSADDAVSPAGAIGRYQIMPDTARQYGFDPNRLTDPQYNTTAAQRILEDLSSKFKNEDGTVDIESVLIAYNAGPARARRFRANGRQVESLPNETRRYLIKAGDDLEGNGGHELIPAPKGGSGGAPPREPPKLLPGPDEGEGAWNNYSTEMLYEKTNEIIKAPSLASTTFDSLRRAWRRTWSELGPSKDFDDDLKKFYGHQGVGPDKITMTDMMRAIYGALGRADARIYMGGHRLKVGKNGAPEYQADGAPAFWKILKAAHKIDKSFDGFHSHMQWLDTIDREKLGLKTTLDPNLARAGLRRHGNKYDALVSDWQKANHSALWSRVDAGLLSVGMARDWLRDHPHWYPQISPKKAAQIGRQSKFGLGTLSKKAKGQEGMIEHPILSTFQSMRKGEHMESVNYARRVAVDLIKKYVGGEETPLLVPRERRISQQRAPEGRRLEHNEQELYDSEGNLIEEAHKKYFESNPNVIRYLKDGRMVEYHVPEMPGREHFVNMLMNMATIDRDLPVNFFNRFTRTLRAGVLENPGFVARALMKDSVAVSIINKHGGAPIFNMLPGVLAVVGKNKSGGLFHEAMINNVLGTALTEMDRNHAFDDMKRLEIYDHTHAQSGGVSSPQEALKQIATLGSSTAYAARDFVRTADAVPRIGVFKRSKDDGVGAFKAGILAREATGDFAERFGMASLNHLNSLIPFYRAAIRGGINNDWRQMQRDPIRILAAGTAYAAVNVSIYFYNEAYEKYYNIPEEQRFRQLSLDFWDRNIPIHTPWGDKKIPGVWEIHTLFGGLPIRLLEWARDERPTMFEEYGNSVLNSMLSTGGFNPMSAIPPFRALAEVTTGTDQVTGYDVVPRSLQVRQGWQQFRPWTSETAKGLARLLGPQGVGIADFSPMYIDKIVNDLGGTIGQEAIHLLDPVLDNDRAKVEQDFNLFETSFNLRHPGMNARSIQEFYKHYTAFTAARASKAAAKNMGDHEDYKALVHDPALVIKLDKAVKALANERKIIDRVTYNKNMSESDKQQRLDAEYRKMIRIADQQNKRVRHALERAQ